MSMCKVVVIISFLLILNLNSSGQNNNDKIIFVHEVDSILKHIESLKNDQVILYYPDGAITYGIILWTKGNICDGLAFKKTSKVFLVKEISRKNIEKSSLLNQFSDSFDVFQKYIPTGLYETSHDFNVAWVYSANAKTDTIIRRMSEVIGGRDYFCRTIFLKFEKLFDLCMSSNSPQPFRKKRKVKNGM